MSQNKMFIHWDSIEVDNKLHNIMKNIHSQCVEYGTENNFTNALLTSMILLNSQIATWLELLRSFAVLFLVMQTNLVYETLLAGDLFAIHALVNIIYIILSKPSLIRFSAIKT